MTQIKKTLSIAGIIAMVTAPAMADIASTAYVQNIVNNMIPTSGTVGHVLKKTTSGVEWAAAPTPTLETTTGQSTTATMTQKAITDALNTKLENTSTVQNTLAIGGGSVDYDPDIGPSAASGALVIGNGSSDGGATVIGYGASGWDNATIIGKNASGGGIAIGVDAGGDGVAIGNDAYADSNGVAIGAADPDDGDTYLFAAEDSVAIGWAAHAYANESIAIGAAARVEENATNAIQLGFGTNDTPNSFSVSIGDKDGKDNTISYPLLVSGGTIPYERFAPEIPNTCKAANNQTCALVIKWNSAQNEFTQSWEVVKVN